MKASHPFWSGLAGWIVIPTVTGLAARLFTPKTAAIETSATVAGLAHAASAFACYHFIDKTDGNMTPFVKWGGISEAIDVVTVPAAMIFADTAAKMVPTPSATSATAKPVSQMTRALSAVAPRGTVPPMSSLEMAYRAFKAA